MSDSTTVDRKRVEAICRGNDALAIDLVRMLVDEAAPIVAELGDCVKWHDVRRVRELAHSLKGIAGNVGAFELRDAASRLEDTASPDRLPLARALDAEVVAIGTALEGVRGTLHSWQLRMARNSGIFAP